MSGDDNGFVVDKLWVSGTMSSRAPNKYSDAGSTERNICLFVCLVVDVSIQARKYKYCTYDYGFVVFVGSVTAESGTEKVPKTIRIELITNSVITTLNIIVVTSLSYPKHHTLGTTTSKNKQKGTILL